MAYLRKNFHMSQYTISNHAIFTEVFCNPEAIHVPCNILGYHLVWPFRLVVVLVFGLFGLWPFRFVAVSVCGRFGLWPFRFVAVSVCGRSGVMTPLGVTTEGFWMDNSWSGFNHLFPWQLPGHHRNTIQQPPWMMMGWGEDSDGKTINDTGMAGGGLVPNWEVPPQVPIRLNSTQLIVALRACSFYHKPSPSSPSPHHIMSFITQNTAIMYHPASFIGHNKKYQQDVLMIPGGDHCGS